MLNKEARCLNLSTSVAVVLYEALRQTVFNHAPPSLTH
jgi:tRNA(Leu) C34 or U34 (ribose-2'-O)-methylase TrmL